MDTSVLQGIDAAVVRRIRLATGVTLEFVEQGDGDGLPVVMLHGVTDSWRSFAPVLPHLPRTLRAFALTQRGHGDADRPEAGYHPRDFAADVVAFADALGLERVFVVGHSMGSTNAMRFAIDHPDRCLGLVLAGAFARYQAHAELVGFWRDEVQRLVDPIDAALARDFQLSTLAQPVEPAFLDIVVGESLKVPARVWRAAFDGFMADEMAADYRRIAAPTLLLHGGRDQLAGTSDQHALLAAIAGARLAQYAEAGHAVHWEEPARFAADVAAFAAAVDARRVSAAASARFAPV